MHRTLNEYYKSEEMYNITSESTLQKVNNIIDSACKTPTYGKRKEKVPQTQSERKSENLNRQAENASLKLTI